MRRRVDAKALLGLRLLRHPSNSRLPATESGPPLTKKPSNKCVLWIASFILIALLLASATPSNGLAQTDQRCGQVCQLKKQVKKLQAQRDVARAELSQAQGSVAGAIGTMAPPQVWNLMQEIANVFTTPQYQNSYFSNASDYQSWTFTWCGFC